MTNKEFHKLLLNEKDSNNQVSKNLMNRLVLEHKAYSNFDELCKLGKIVRISNDYLIKK